MTTKNSKELTPKKKSELKLISFTDIQKKKIIEMYNSGITIWEITDSMFNFPFDHSNEYTWMFYSRINKIRKKGKGEFNKLIIPTEVKTTLSKILKETKPKELLKHLEVLLVPIPKVEKPKEKKPK